MLAVVVSFGSPHKIARKDVVRTSEHRPVLLGHEKPSQELHLCIYVDTDIVIIEAVDKLFLYCVLHMSKYGNT